MEFNYESGLGRPDLVIKDKKKRRVVIMEMKITDSLESMKKTFLLSESSLLYTLSGVFIVSLTASIFFVIIE